MSDHELLREGMQATPQREIGRLITVAGVVRSDPFNHLQRVISKHLQQIEDAAHQAP
jgi:hypothetical protein